MMTGKFWRVLYAFIAGLLYAYAEYFLDGTSIAIDDNIFTHLYVCFVIISFIVFAWIWDDRRVYRAFNLGTKKPASYKTWLNIGAIFFFLLMICFIVGIFIFPENYHSFA